MGDLRKNPKVDEFIDNTTAWQDEFICLRAIALACPLTEELKWGVPCYTFEGKNVALLHGFKEYCAILFVKGALLRDPQGVLIRQTENVQAARQIRFTDVRQIDALKSVLMAYLSEAIEIERAGLTVEMKPTDEFELVEELRQQFDQNRDFQAAFEALTPGRRRAYLLHFSQPKQSKTRTDRIEKWKQHILEGKGMND